MASVTYSLEDGLGYDEDSVTTIPRYTLVAHVADLNEGTDQELIAQAIALMPPLYTPGDLYGVSPTYGTGSTVLLRRRFRPFAPVDCFVELNYGPRMAGTLLGPEKLEIGTTLSQQQTSFDAANRALPFTMRTPIKVQYDSTSSGAPGASAPKQGGQVPYYAQWSTATFTVTLPTADYNVGALGTAYSGYRNLNTWKGEPPGSILMMAIQGVSNDGQITMVTKFNVAYDPFDLWIPFLRYIDPVSSQAPVLTNGQIAANNGVTPIKVQGDIDFSSLPI